VITTVDGSGVHGFSPVVRLDLGGRLRARVRLVAVEEERVGVRVVEEQRLTLALEAAIAVKSPKWLRPWASAASANRWRPPFWAAATAPAVLAPAAAMPRMKSRRVEEVIMDREPKPRARASCERCVISEA
jgi:hypothetical protein